MCIAAKWQIGSFVFTHLADCKSKCRLFCSSDLHSSSGREGDFSSVLAVWWSAANVKAAVLAHINLKQLFGVQSCVTNVWCRVNIPT